MEERTAALCFVLRSNPTNSGQSSLIWVKSSRRGMENFILDIQNWANSDIFTIFLDRVLIRVQDVMEGIQVAFASYYVFGYSYVAELPKSLEFIQR